MYKIEPDQTLCQIMKLFHQLGVWRNGEESDSRKLRRRLLYLIGQLSFLASVLLSAFLSDDRNQQIFLMEIVIIVVLVTIKLAYLLWRKDEILQFFYDPTVTHYISNYDEWMHLNGRVKKILKFNRAYTLLVLLCPFFIASLPIFSHGKMLPLFIRFDSESDYDFILYWVAYVFLSLGTLFSCQYNCAISLIWYIMFNYSIEYEILGNRFKRLGWTSEAKRTGKESKSRIGKTFQQDLIGLIHAHRNLKETVERFRSCFSTLFLAEIITGAISICASTYNLAYNNSDNFFQMVYFVIVAFYAFFEIFLAMFLANEITVQSDRLSYCLFMSNWTEQSEKTKQSIIILCEMIRKPQQLVVFIYPMNLEKFTSIVNGAYSMFNILKSFNQ